VVSPSVVRVARLLALAVAIGFGLAFVIANVRSWELEDMDAYWNAALRLKSGLPLYPPTVEAAPDTYRYAPWLAWVWVPLTELPKAVVQVAWSVLLIGASVAAILPLARIRSAAALCLLALLGGLLVKTASTGNVHALIIAMLVYGVQRRSGWFWVGVAASIKIVPLAFVLVWLGRGQWMRAFAAILVAGILWAPALAYGIGSYPMDASGRLSLLSLVGAPVWAAVAIVAAGATLALARSRYGALAAATTMVALVPRLDFYDLTYLLVGVPRRGDPDVNGNTGGEADRRISRQ
jgi:hypothetical protein